MQQTIQRFLAAVQSALRAARCSAAKIEIVLSCKHTGQSRRLPPSEGKSGFQTKLMPLETVQVYWRYDIGGRTACDLDRPGGAQVAILANADEKRRSEIERAAGKARLERPIRQGIRRAAGIDI